MSAFVISVKNRQVVEALQKGIKNLPVNVDQSVELAALETGNKLKDGAPKANTILTNSIKAARIALMHWRVGPHVDYAESVEQGSRGGGFPPLQAIVSWIKTKGITPRNPEFDLNDLAWVIRRKILQRGIKAQPFVQPVADSGFPQRRLKQLVEAAAQQTLSEAGL